ncbi:MAG TPA: hypothetical protein VHZ81_12535 [Galbitalea sp.]|jgi:hypothetical protein|nr:hypothetical protein [Galbitalea sp.]
MSDEKSREVDPRFDPAFQRGFDPTIPITESVPEPVERRAAAAPPTATRAPAPARQPIPAAEPVAPAKPVARAAAPLTAPTPVVEAADSSASDDEPVAEIAPETAPSRNPFLLFLGIIAVALIATGIWLFVRSGDAFNSKVVRSQGDYMSLTATINMAPFIALLGAATVIGVLFVFAAKYRGRRPR